MKTVIINFIGGKPLSLRLPAENADGILAALGAGGSGTTTITSGGRTYIVNREQLTFVTSEDE